MLVAITGGKRVEADVAIKGNHHQCPACEGDLILKQGRKVIHHFAHHPGSQCRFAKGETRAHLNAKKSLCEGFRQRGLRAELEFNIGEDNERRADVAVWHPRGECIAIELQHCSISLDEIERRAFSYASLQNPQLWIPFIDKDLIEAGTRLPDKRIVIERYSAPLYVRWIQGLTLSEGIWFFEPTSQKLWHGSLAHCLITVPESSYYDENGDEQFGGGYDRISKRWKTLTLDGPYSPFDLRLKRLSRPRSSLDKYNWPKGRLATFTVPGDAVSS